MYYTDNGQTDFDRIYLRVTLNQMFGRWFSLITFHEWQSLTIYFLIYSKTKWIFITVWMARNSGKHNFQRIALFFGLIKNVFKWKIEYAFSN